MRKTILIALVCLCLPLFSLATSLSDTIEYSVSGKITYKSGTVVKIQNTSGDEMPVIAQEGVLSKSFETELFGGKMTGWMSIGRMKVTAITADIITFSLLKEMSVITENGVKKNQFEIGKEVKFEWKIAVSPDEAAFKKGEDLVGTNMDEALVYYRQAVALNPSHAAAYNMIGMILNEKEIYDSSYFCFKKAADLDPKNVQYAKNVSIAAFKAGYGSDSYSYADKAVAIDAKDGEARYLRGLMKYMGNKESLTEADKQAIIADLDMAVQLTADDPFYYSERAFLRKEFGNTTGACEDAKKAKSLGAEDGETLIQTYCQ